MPAIFVGHAQAWLPELIERSRKLVVNGGFEKGADLFVSLTPYKFASFKVMAGVH
jgi:hypothetical protein